MDSSSRKLIRPEPLPRYPRLTSLGVPTRPLMSVMLVVVLAVAFGVRVWGLQWGLPDRTHYFSYHPDEGTIIAAAARMNVFTGDLNPHFFNYGSLQLYLVHLACQFCSGWGYLDFGGLHAGFLDSVRRAHLVARMLTVFMGLGAVWLVWLLGRRIGGEETGLWAAALLALCAGHAVNSHYATVDVPLTFWTTCCLLGCVALAQHGSTRWAVAAGVALGFAAATKYGAVVLVVPVVVASCLAPRDDHASGAGRTAAVVLGTAAAAFLIACPYSLLDWPRFLHDVRWESQHMRTGSGLLFVGTGNGWWYHVRESLPLCLGWPVFLAGGAALFPVLRRRQPAVLVLVSFLGAYFLMIGAAQVRFVRYALPLLPPFVVLLAAVLTPSDRSPLAVPARTLLAGLVLLSAMQTCLSCRSFASPDPRDQVLTWLEQHATPTAKVGLVTTPWFYTPPVCPYNGGPHSRALFEADPEARRYGLCVTGWDAVLLDSESPDFFLLSEFEFREQLRLCGRGLSAVRISPDAGVDRRFVAFWNRLHERYEPALIRGGWEAPWWLAPRGYVPHDWLYPCPQTRVYRRRAAE